MLSKIRIILILGLYSVALNAKETPPFLGTPEGCQIHFFKENKSNQTKLICKNFNFQKSQMFLDSKFLRWATIKKEKEVYIILFFTKGVHGEQAIIFSQTKKKMLKEIASSWPIKIIKKKDVTFLNYKKDSDEKGNYADHFYSIGK